MEYNTPFLSAISDVKEKGTLLEKSSNLLDQLTSLGSKWFLRFSSDLPIYTKKSVGLIAIKSAIDTIPGCSNIVKNIVSFEEGKLSADKSLNSIMNAFDSSALSVFNSSPLFEVTRGVVKNLAHRLITFRVDDFNHDSQRISNPTFTDDDIVFLELNEVDKEQINYDK